MSGKFSTKALATVAGMHLQELDISDALNRHSYKGNRIVAGAGAEHFAFRLRLRKIIPLAIKALETLALFTFEPAKYFGKLNI